MTVKSPMQTLVPRRSSACVECSSPFGPDSSYVSFLEEWERTDYCPSCWEKHKKEGHFWLGKIPPKEEKRSTPDEKALALFRKLAEESPEESAQMLYLLMLYLERNKQLIRRKKGKRRVICEISETGEAFVLPLCPTTPEEGESLTHELAKLIDG